MLPPFQVNLILSVQDGAEQITNCSYAQRCPRPTTTTVDIIPNQKEDKIHNTNSELPKQLKHKITPLIGKLMREKLALMEPLSTVEQILLNENSKENKNRTK